MHGIKPTFALTASLALLFAGCEWSGTSNSNAWSNAYDAMNFSGSYRTVVSTATTTATTQESESGAFKSTTETATFAKGSKTASGHTSLANIVPGSFQASVGGYVWSDTGNGSLVFTNPNGGGSTDSSPTVVEKSESLGTLTGDKSQQFDLSGSSLVPGSVTVKAGSMTFHDDGGGTLIGGSATASGTVNYESGAITLNFKSTVQAGQSVSATYTYTVSGSSSMASPVSGVGSIQYSSGGWSLQLSEGMASAETITLHYSYYLENSDTTPPYSEINDTKVKAISVSQSGQNLSMHFNNGIVMSGRFTGVRQTGKINQDTSTGYNTYNAQFEVASGSESKMVGTLNYDLQLGVRTLNGTWTWGRNTYDVQAVGPAWLNSADTSTLQYEVVTDGK